jgi:hypothetical protein
MSPGPAAVLRFVQEGDPIVRFLRTKFQEEFASYSDNQIESALKIILDTRNSATSSDALTDEPIDESEFRYHEFKVLRENKREDDLVVDTIPRTDLSPNFRSVIAGVSLVERLKETRVFTGFSRIFSENAQTLWDRKQLLWQNPPRGRRSWLPAYVVHGEGIFIQLDETAVKRWESQPGVIARYKALAHRLIEVQEERHLREQELTPRLVLIHTLAHVLMARLTFECGYSSASLRERLYVSNESGREMAGLMIYTADGDADGTMGGLVRMGKPQFLEAVIQRALEQATWCSADPVCSEAGGHGGQGPDGLNLAACHSCCLVPETACEQFNRFLDRNALVSGSPSASGFFADVVSAAVI